MSLDDHQITIEPRFQIDIAASSLDAFLCLECTRCEWIVEIEAPVDYTDVQARFAEQADICTSTYGQACAARTPGDPSTGPAPAEP